MEQIEKVQSGSATLLEKEVVYRNDQLRYLIDMHGEEKAMNIARRKGVEILDKTLKMERDINKEKFGKAFKEAKRAGNVRAGLTGKVVRGVTGGRFGQNMATGLSNEERAMIGQYQNLMADDSSSERLRNVKIERRDQFQSARKAYSDQVKFLEKAIGDRVRSEATQQYRASQTDGYLQQFGQITEEMYQKAFESSEEMQRARDELAANFKGINELFSETIDSLEVEVKDRERMIDASRDVLERAGFKTKGKQVKRVGAIDRAKDKESLAELVNSNSFLQGLFAPLMPVIEVGRAVKGVAKNIGPLFRTAKLFLGQALKFLAGVMITIAIVGLLYFLFKDNIKDFIDNKWPTIKDNFIEAYRMIEAFFEKAVGFVVAYYNLVVALFSGERELVMQRARELWEAGRDLVKSLVADLLVGALKLGGTLLELLYEGLRNIFFPDKETRQKNDENKNRQAMNANLKRVAELTEKRQEYEVGTKEYNKLTRQINRAQNRADRREERMLYRQAVQEMSYGQRLGARVRGGTQGKDRESIIEDMRDGTLDAFSSGGVSGGGMALVGEGGPELVSLPTGARVFNNSQSRNMMGNVINIHVNGRMGASDQELNELARKLGEKINKEMNRFGASGFRA